MSSTRHAQPGSPPRQERYASSFERGLLANLVAKRCERLESQAQRELIWFLQWASWGRDGMEWVRHWLEWSDCPEDLCLNPEAILPEASFQCLRKCTQEWLQDRTSGRVADLDWAAHLIGAGLHP
jgi:hypothetical protein